MPKTTPKTSPILSYLKKYSLFWPPPPKKKEKKKKINIEIQNFEPQKWSEPMYVLDRQTERQLERQTVM